MVSQHGHSTLEEAHPLLYSRLIGSRLGNLITVEIPIWAKLPTSWFALSGPLGQIAEESRPYLESNSIHLYGLVKQYEDQHFPM